MADTPVKLIVAHKNSWGREEAHPHGSLSKAVDHAAELVRNKDEWRPQRIMDERQTRALLVRAELLKAIHRINWPKTAPPKAPKKYRLITVREAPKPPLHTEHRKLADALMAASRMRLTVGHSIAIQRLSDNHVVMDEAGIRAAMRAWEIEKGRLFLGEAHLEMEMTLPGFGSW